MTLAAPEHFSVPQDFIHSGVESAKTTLPPQAKPTLGGSVSDCEPGVRAGGDSATADKPVSLPALHEVYPYPFGERPEWTGEMEDDLDSLISKHVDGDITDDELDKMNAMSDLKHQLTNRLTAEDIIIDFQMRRLSREIIERMEKYVRIAHRGTQGPTAPSA